ncbi:ABC-2 type transport system permease protein [Prauserella rugosa]|uniref:ABC-2 type transport system permease protein n=2 Tax=Prauserella rugosa TaxID=43354 RepID=A0A660CAI2_9PSEU|nr:ABC-2 family transporter protein [Prauserella sp. Am3]TWH20482.1 ABC-2 type transport system permease protein [Prauserella rugosa]
MMGNLIKAEFRKILTTKSWWALLIPAAVLAFAFAAGLGYIANEFGNILTSSEAERIASALGIETGSLPMGLLAVGRAINMALMFAVIIGVFAVAGEYSKKTITTTFLTAPNRAMALTSKMITYISWGALYGLAAVAAASLGILLGVDSERLPTASQWLGVAGASVLAGALATLFGVGVGALWKSVAGSVVTLLLYMLLAENLWISVSYGIWGNDVAWMGAVLPNGALNGVVGAIPAEVFGASGVRVPGMEDDFAWFLQNVAGAPGAFSWWGSALIFGGWVLLFFGGGWLVNQKRDIT